MLIKTVADLKKALADMPDDTLLVKETEGYYCCLRQPYVGATYIANYQSEPGESPEAKSREDFRGKNVLFLEIE